MNMVQKFNKENSLPSFNKKWFNPISADEFKEKSTKATISGKPEKVWKDIIKRFFKNKWNIVFLLILSLIVFFLIFGNLFAKFASDKPVSEAVTSSVKYMKPSFTNQPLTTSGDIKQIHTILDNSVTWDSATNTLFDPKGRIISSHEINGLWTVKYNSEFYTSTMLGTDQIGVSVYARLISSSRFSISLAVIVTFIEMLIGVFVGLYLGFNAGKWLDTYFMRFVEIISAIPALLLITIFVLVLGKSFMAFAFALIIVGWIGPVYITRMFTMKIKDAEFIKASQSIGASQSRVLFKHVLPNIIGRVIVQFVHRIPSVIFIESTLIFLGIQVGGDTHNTLGSMLQSARLVDAVSSNPFYLIAPATTILLFTLSLQILANGLRDAFDAKVSS